MVEVVVVELALPFAAQVLRVLGAPKENFFHIFKFQALSKHLRIVAVEVVVADELAMAGVGEQVLVHHR